MPFTIEPLPYAMNALEPHISEKTLSFHYGKHHQGYVNKLNELLEKPENSALATGSLEDVVKQAKGPLYNQAAQHWNHSFYWKCMTPNKTTPSEALAKAIDAKYGSLQGLLDAFSTAAAGHFGSGWVFLVKDKDGLNIVGCHDADCPIKEEGKTPLLVIDVWEHAYYLDKQNRRPDYIKDFIQLINWEFVSANFEK